MAEDRHQGATRESQLSWALTESRFIFVRFWPGFSERFPYKEFDDVSDDVIDAKLRIAVETELQRQSVRRGAIYRVNDEAKGFPEYEFMRLAELVGWSDGRYRIEAAGQPRLCTRKLCIGVIDSLEETEAAIKELVSRDAIKSDCITCQTDCNFGPFECPFSNPRYTFAACESFDRGERTRAKLAIDRLRSGNEIDALEKHAGTKLQIIDAFHFQWENTGSSLSRGTAVMASGFGPQVKTTRGHDVSDGVSVVDHNSSNGSSRPKELLTPQDIADLFGITKGRVLTKLSEDRPSASPIKKGGRAPDSYCYSEIRPWLLNHWPEKEPLLGDFSNVQRILHEKWAHKSARETRKK